MGAFGQFLTLASDALPEQIKNTLYVRFWAFSKVPMLNWVRPKVIRLDAKETTISIPLNRRTKNHLNSMYFGTLACGADIAGGLIAMKLINESSERLSFVFKDFKAIFLKRPESDTLFTCRDGDSIQKLIDDAIKTKERQNTTVHVTATCPDKFDDEPVAEFELTLSVKVKNKR